MQNRIYKHIEDILKFTEEKFYLTLIEKALIESFLTALLNRDEEKLKQIEYLLNEEDSELLETLHQRGIEDYACRQFGMISKNDTHDLVGALKDLNFDFLKEVTDTEMIEALEEDGWHVSLDNGYTNNNIVEESQFEEWTELFSKLSVQERESILKGKL